MSTKPDGGPAFPQTIDDMGTLRCNQVGMSLRDYFAAAALTGKVSNNILDAAMTEEACNLAFVDAAAFAYRCADAMLAERERRRGLK